ncbi:MAG: aminomethyltransferase [Gammaproteobacteria bacterium]|jgi:aminomethyltransferase
MGQKTPLYQSHLQASAKMVDFAGWDMPINYGSQINEHEIIRSSAGMFDVSHMTIVDVTGEETVAYLRHLLANNIDKLKAPGSALYSCMLNASGGVVDDLIAYKIDASFYRLVINSATREKDLNWLNQQKEGFNSATLKARDDLAIIAVQGPEAVAKTIGLLDDSDQSRISSLGRFKASQAGDLFIARTGYTGEDGFEVILPADQASEFWDKLLDAGVKPCGLGARDTLRLEAGMNLYGTDMDESVSPLDAGLAWTVEMDSDRSFVGKDALLEQRQSGLKTKFCGLILRDKGVLRNHLKVVTAFGEGEITSGSFSPTLGKSIAFARLPIQSEGRVEVEIRNRLLSAQIVDLPFVRQGKIITKLEEIV